MMASHPDAGKWVGAAGRRLIRRERHRCWHRYVAHFRQWLAEVCFEQWHHSGGELLDRSHHRGAGHVADGEVDIRVPWTVELDLLVQTFGGLLQACFVREG